ncbi:flavin reductase family protein [Taklimakanibacter deserti]|uniref:flavin reductase family protein n=1 Tax=Taklimakanibacter deserti TaxID=2267839 RepID=UPI0013C4341F
MTQVAGHIEESFRTAMRTFAGTVSVITTCGPEGEWRGMAATAVTSVSMAPPTCLICVNREATLHPALITSRRFCINAMHHDHHALIGSFASSHLRDSRFLSGQWRVDGAGVPFLEDAQSNIFCEMFDRHPIGTHDVVFGRVVEVKVRPDHDPLLYGDGAYYRLAKH